MMKADDFSKLENFESWEFSEEYTKEKIVSLFKSMLANMQKDTFKIDVNGTGTREGPLEVNLPKEVLFQAEYDHEPMVTSEDGAKKYYLAIKFFWSDKGVKAFLAEEAELAEEEEDFAEEEEDFAEEEEDFAEEEEDFADIDEDEFADDTDTEDDENSDKNTSKNKK